MNKKNPLIKVFAFFAVLLLAGIGMIFLGPQNDAATIADARKAGVLTAEDVNVAFEKVSAKLIERRVIESDHVKKGDVLMVLDPTDNTLAIDSVRAQIEQNEASIASQSAVLEAARKEYRRAQALIKTGAVSRSVYDSAQSAYLTAEAALKELQAARKTLDVSLKQLEVEKGRLILKAPEDGKILTLMFQAGEMVPAGSPAVLLETERHYYDIYVSEAHAKRYLPGSTVTGFVPALNRTVKGTVRFCTAAPSFADLRMTREHGSADLTSFQVRIYVEPLEQLLPGMTIEVRDE